MQDAGWNSGSAFMLNMAETLTGMVGIEGAKAALKHHFMEECPHVGSPVEDKDVGLLMKGLQRRFQVPVKKKPAMSRKNILLFLCSVMEQGRFGEVGMVFFRK